VQFEGGAYRTRQPHLTAHPERRRVALQAIQPIHSRSHHRPILVIDVKVLTGLNQSGAGRRLDSYGGMVTWIGVNGQDSTGLHELAHNGIVMVSLRLKAVGLKGRVGGTGKVSRAPPDSDNG
jgi:hypothetical protein